MGTRIALVRHGETDWNAEGRLQGQVDIPLNEAGRGQAAAAGRELLRSGDDGGSWEVLVSSPLGRAVETASVIGAHLGLEPIAPVGDLRERGYGDGERRVVEGMDRRELDRLLATAEPEGQVADRGIAALAGLVHEHPGQGLVVVAHGTLIRLVMGALRGAPHPRLGNGDIVWADAGQIADAARGRPVPRPVP